MFCCECIQRNWVLATNAKFVISISSTQNRRPLMFQTLNSVRINSLSLKYERFTPTGCKDIGNRTFEFVAKTQFLSHSS